jgi:hypothetical protein
MTRTLGGLLALVLCCTLGCGTSTTVSGKVTLDGQPLTKGTVTFSPKGEAPAATSQIDSSGNYRLSVGTSSNVAPGSYQVTIDAVELVPPTPTDPSPLPKKLLPAKYYDGKNPEMVREVKAGENKINFDLKSMP